ncbi:MAG: tRNA guanosine(34) transglycosylase Tgt [Candidatus Aminicenantes bacterium 4484_214]|nr:MAG: tRNA guanosine(34) transglycosylase Tgt [Candidatus Aminicenantes bacterium 4484_214]
MMKPTFKILVQDSQSAARTGVINTAHGPIYTPAFAPVGSQGTVKALTHELVNQLGAQLVLVNAYHLFLRPGLEVIKKMKGVHNFISWPKAILSDSGGFQIYSLSPLTKVHEKGVSFASHLDGAKIFLTPQDVVEIQAILGSDIIMPLDYFTPYPSSYEQAKSATQKTSSWARESKEYFSSLNNNHQLLFGIGQGGTFSDLRQKSIEDLLELDFDGYALGGLGLGEPKSLFFEIVSQSTSSLPLEKPRYLMGVGYLEDIVEAVALGIDLFDCVLPTRNARNGTLFTSQGRLRLKRAQYATDERPIDENCQCYTCQHFSRAYLRHLFERSEITSAILNTIHNLYFYLDIFRKIRQAISSNSFLKFKEDFLKKSFKDKENEFA